MGVLGTCVCALGTCICVGRLCVCWVLVCVLDGCEQQSVEKRETADNQLCLTSDPSDLRGSSRTAYSPSPRTSPPQRPKQHRLLKKGEKTTQFCFALLRIKKPIRTVGISTKSTKKYCLQVAAFKSALWPLIYLWVECVLAVLVPNAWLKMAAVRFKCSYIRLDKIQYGTWNGFLQYISFFFAFTGYFFSLYHLYLTFT